MNKEKTNGIKQAELDALREPHGSIHVLSRGESLEEDLKEGKPPVLNGNELADAVWHKVEGTSSISHLEAAAQAQYDALVAYYKPLIQQERSKYYDVGYAQAVKDSQDIIGQRECFWQAQVKDEIKQAKAEEREKVLDEIQAGAVSVATLVEKARAEGIRKVVEFLHRQGAVWVDKNYAIIKAIENGEAFKKKALEGK